MPQTGFTPIQNYNSPTAGHIPINTDLYAGELAINMTDEKLYFKNTGGTVKLLASTAVFTTTGSGSYVLATSPTITGHPTIEGVTSTGATGTGKFVFDSAPTITGHPTIEGVTSTGATGTGKFMFDSAPTITGHPTIEGVTSTGATGTGKFVFDSAPTITGHPTIEGVTSTGATGTGKFVFDSSPTLSGVTLSDGTANGVAYLNSSKVLTSGSGLVFDSSGNLGLGVVPSAWNTAYSQKSIQFGPAGSLMSLQASTTNNQTFLSSNAVNLVGGWAYQYSDKASQYQQYAGTHIWNTAPSGTAGNAISFTQAMTLNASGNLLVGTTSAIGGDTLQVQGKTIAGTDYCSLYSGTSGTVYASRYYHTSSVVGSVTFTSTATAYNTSSDYRLKNVTGPITNSGAYIDSLNPVEGTWKSDGSAFVGLIAHEVQDVSRTTVTTGIKDGEEMQGMDYSSAEIIANLIAELQSLRKRVNQLENKL